VAAATQRHPCRRKHRQGRPAQSRDHHFALEASDWAWVGAKDQRFRIKFGASGSGRDRCVAHGLACLCVGCLKRRNTLDLHNFLTVLTQAKFHLREKLIDHIVAATHPIVDEVVIAVRT